MPGRGIAIQASPALPSFEQTSSSLRALASRLRPVTIPQLSRELGFRAMVLVLAVASLLASMVVIRFSGFGGPSLWNVDSPQASFPLASFFHEALVNGRLPFWNDRLNLGLPLYAEGQIGAFYPPNWLIYQLPPIQALDLSRILHLTFAGVGTGLIVLRLAGSRTGAVTAALVAVLCGGVAAKLEWVNVIVVYSWVPWIVLPLVWSRSRPTTRNVVVAGILWGIQAIAAFPPYWVLTGILAALLIMLRSRDLSGLRRVLVFGMYGVAVGAVQLVPTLVLTSLSPRGEGLQLSNLFEYSATPFDFLGLAFANALVPAGSPAWDVNQTWYPGGFWAFLESYMFVGLPALGLGVAGLRVRRARPFALIGIVALAIPLIGVLQPAIWAAIPGLNGLRHPVRAYMFLDLALAIGAGFGISRLGSKRVWRTSVLVMALVTAGYVLVLGLAAAGAADALWATVLPGQENLVRNQVVGTMASLWPLGLELALGGLALAVFRVRPRAPGLRIAAAALAILPMALLVPGINQSLSASAFSLAGTPIVATIESDSPRAVLTRNEPYYPGLSEVLGVRASPQPHIFSTQFQASLYFQATRDLIQAMRSSGSDTALLRAVGIDTVVDFKDQCAGRPVARDPETGATICRIDDALHPPYWIPSTATAVSGGEPRSFITPSDALIEPHGAIAEAVPAMATSRDEGQSTIIVDAKAPGYVFVDRSWWPGWRVSVDGISVTPYRALSGQLVPVEAGHHVIEEHFFAWDAALGLLFGVGALVILGAWLAFDRRRRGSSRVTIPAPSAYPSRPEPHARPLSMDGASTRFQVIAVPTRLRAARIRGASFAWELVGLSIASLFGALVVDRFSGLGGPWLWNYDMTTIDYPLATMFHDALANGRLPLWTDLASMGFPTYADGQIGAFYPPNWLIFQLPALQALDVSRVVHLVLAGVGAGLIALRLAGTRSGAITAALVTVLCGGIASKLEWTQVVVVYGWMPWVLLPLLWRRPGPSPPLVALAGLLWGVQALGGHPPYWTLTGIAVVVLILAQSPWRRGLAHIVEFGLIGIGVGAIQIVPTLLLTAMSARAGGIGTERLFEFSATPVDFLAIAFSNAFVQATNPAWDITQSWYPGGVVWSTLEVYAFVGLPAIAFAVAGFATRRARPLLLLAAVLIAIPIVGVFKPDLWAAIPGLNGLRHPVRVYLMLDLVLAIVAGIGVARIGRISRSRAPMFVVGALIAGYAFVATMAILLPGLVEPIVTVLWSNLTPGGAEQVRLAAVQALTSAWPVTFELAVAVLALVVIRSRERTPLQKAIAMALVAAPLLLTTGGINQSLPASAFEQGGTSFAQALRSADPNTIYADTVAGPRVWEAGYRGTYVFSSLDIQQIEDLRLALVRNPDSKLARAVGIDTVVSATGSCVGRQVASDAPSGTTICRLDGAARPPYWLPTNAVAAPPGAAGSSISPAEAVVDAGRALAEQVGGTVRSWDDATAVIDVNAPADGYVFIDRTWWPGWQVTVDGKSVTPARAWSGQLVAVTAGLHTIEEHLVPWDAFLGVLVSLVSLSAIGLWAWRRPRLRKTIGSRMAGDASAVGESRPTLAKATPRMSLPFSRRLREQARQATSWNPSTFWALLALVTVGIGIPTLVAAAAGALGVPLADDWDYRRVALGLYERGQIELTGFEGKSLIGQVVFVQPFLWLSRGQAWGFTAATIVLGVIGVAAGFLVVRRILPVGWAILAVLIFLLVPGFLRFTTSFMTDVPAFAAALLCLAMGASALDRRGVPRWRWLAASLLVGAFAFSIREFALAAPIAVVIAAATQDSWRRSYWLAGAAVLFACGLILLVVMMLPGYRSITPLNLLSLNSVEIVRAMTTPALALSPALVIAAATWWPRWRLPDLFAGAAIGVLIFSAPILTLVGTGSLPRVLSGYMLEREGILSINLLAGGRPVLFEPAIWSLLNYVSLAAAILAFAICGGALGAMLRPGGIIRERHLGTWIGSTSGLLAVYSVLTVGGLLAIGINAAFIDRYVWPIVLPVAALLLLRPEVVPSRNALRAGMAVSAAAVMVGLAVFSSALFVNSNAFDAARWQMGERAVARGYAASTIDSGMEWVGYHATGPVLTPGWAGSNENYYDGWFASFRLCAMVSSSPLNLPGFSLDQFVPNAYRLLVVAGPAQPMYLYRVNGPHC
jgi:hypothetical protein